MNYLEWSNSYLETSKDMEAVIKKLNDKKKTALPSEKKEIDLRISKYRLYYYECISIANHLLLRHEGVE